MAGFTEATYDDMRALEAVGDAMTPSSSVIVDYVAPSCVINDAMTPSSGVIVDYAVPSTVVGDRLR